MESIPGWLQKGVGYFRKPLSREERMVQEVAQARLLTVWRSIFRYSYFGFASWVLFRVACDTKQGLVSSLLLSDIKAEDAMEVVGQYGFEGYFLCSAILFRECPRLLTWRNIYTWISVMYVHAMVFVFATPRLTAKLPIVIIIQGLISTHRWNRYFIFSLNASWTILVCFVNLDGYARQAFVFLLFGMTVGQSLCIRLRQNKILAATLEAAYEKLLYGVCDAVAHMSKDFALTRPCPQLDALLLRNFANAGPGLNFLDVLSKDDGGRFCGFIQRAQADDVSGRGEPSSLTSTMHVELRNAHDMPVVRDTNMIFHGEANHPRHELCVVQLMLPILVCL